MQFVLSRFIIIFGITLIRKGSDRLFVKAAQSTKQVPELPFRFANACRRLSLSQQPKIKKPLRRAVTPNFGLSTVTTRSALGCCRMLHQASMTSLRHASCLHLQNKGNPCPIKQKKNAGLKLAACKAKTVNAESSRVAVSVGLLQPDRCHRLLNARVVSVVSLFFLWSSRCSQSSAGLKHGGLSLRDTGINTANLLAEGTSLVRDL